ncbi:hypothetical protein [Brunnivagina elsteri]|uniref:Uncharacterized protein n=1 Tax=Brunnivagina elsteri CCALA 953 TaxID=987040 RepID=A0A2A2T9S8_9CYAN|nr:hypothetical protein [Calothrix elsteri]PAX45675.1 hypothetical protein CK510_30560 [Calothrix elsteri CCALA 953]
MIYLRRTVLLIAIATSISAAGSVPKVSATIASSALTANGETVQKASQDLQTAQSNSKLALNEQQDSCARQAGYPLGRWETTGIANATSAEYSTFITFTTRKSGTWLPASEQGSFTASRTPAPNREVTLTLRPDGNTSYVSTNKLLTSSDGCYMQGTFNDTEKHRGEVQYKWVPQ